MPLHRDNDIHSADLQEFARRLYRPAGIYVNASLPVPIPQGGPTDRGGRSCLAGIARFYFAPAAIDGKMATLYPRVGGCSEQSVSVDEPV